MRQPDYLRRMARKLRRNMTRQERALWDALRCDQIGGRRFRRQHPVGRYVLDFICLKSGLVIEVDGGQHSESLDRDSARDSWLEAQGLRVLRFWNHQVDENLEGVLAVIQAELGIIKE